MATLAAEIAGGQGQRLKVLAELVGRCEESLWRWVVQGAKGPGGETIRLEAMKSPAGYVSTPAAVVRFFEKLTPKHEEAVA